VPVLLGRKCKYPLSVSISPRLEIAGIGEEVRRVRLRKMGKTLVPVLVPVCTEI
jgi:hypothetical protein